MAKVLRSILAVFILIVALPAILALAFLILLVDRMSPFYMQRRFGKTGKEFICFKLQTLRPTKDMASIADPKADALRVTPLGLWIRDHGYDELPQIINIILGSMAFIGPRPLPLNAYTRIREENVEAQDDIKKWEAIRLKALPGLTGWQQIHTNGMSYPAIKYDREYLEYPSLMMRVRIVTASAKILIVGRKRYFK